MKKTRYLFLFCLVLVCMAFAFPAQAVDVMYDEGFDYWLSDDAHITQAADLTINPGFTPAGFWVSVDSLDVKIRMYPASADTTFASPTDWFPLDDGEGMVFPLQVDYITIKVIGTDLGRVRYAFWGHSTP